MLFAFLVSVSTDPIIIDVADVPRRRLAAPLYETLIDRGHDDLGSNLGCIGTYRYTNCLLRLSLSEQKVQTVPEYWDGFPVAILFRVSLPVQCPRQRVGVYGIIEPGDIRDETELE